MTDEAKAVRAADERRSSDRIPVEMWVEEATDRELYFQRGANISEGGIFLEHAIAHPMGTVVSLRFALPGDDRPVRARGEIVNIGEGPRSLGMGIRFVELSDEDRARIVAFVERAGETRR